MTDLETIKTRRHIKATLVPFGTAVDIPEGTEAIVLQALGGTYTVVAGGQTLRVTGEYADALGKEINDVGVYINDDNISLEEKVWMQLKTCYDPEIPVNIVDLGLIYGVIVEPFTSVLATSLSDSSDNAAIDASVVADSNDSFTIDSDSAATIDDEVYKVTVRMTLTAPGCGMGPVIAAEVKQKILAIPKVKIVAIAITFDPPWDRSRLSDAAKLALGLF